MQGNLEGGLSAISTRTATTRSKEGWQLVATCESGVCEMAGLAIYIHWPFCLSKCPYCDFNSHVRESIDHDRWCAALLTELDHYADRTSGRTVTSIFFGGGT